jgi:hypothetical protein
MREMAQNIINNDKNMIANLGGCGQRRFTIRSANVARIAVAMNKGAMPSGVIARIGPARARPKVKNPIVGEARPYP